MPRRVRRVNFSCHVSAVCAVCRCVRRVFFRGTHDHRFSVFSQNFCFINPIIFFSGGFPTLEEIQENEVLKLLWREFNSKDAQDLNIYLQMKSIRIEMMEQKKAKEEKV